MTEVSATTPPAGIPPPSTASAPATAKTPASYPTTPGVSRGDGQGSTGSSGSDGSRIQNRLSKRYFRPSLVDLCVPVMAANFQQFPTFGKIPYECRMRVVMLLPLDLPLDMCAHLIHEDEYWERRSKLHWNNSDPCAHGRSWKQLFFERYFADALERFDPTYERESSLQELLQICKHYIHNLTIYQLPSRLSLSVFFDYVGSELEALKLEYGCRNSGINYDKFNFGMKISDCRSLSAALTMVSALTDLNLSYNSLTDRKVAILVEGMLVNPTIIHLDLSHNEISNDGVKEISKLLIDEGTILTTLNLCNNYISSDGAEKVAEALKENQVLLSLNLRHNLVIKDEGGQAVLESLYVNTALQRLSLSGCGLGEQSAAALARVLHNPKCGLICLDISANCSIGPNGGAVILSALEGGKVMKEMNIKMCDFGEDVEVSISKLLVVKCVPDAKKYIIED